MCECGCVLNNEMYKLKAPSGHYVVQFMPGCDDCSVGPGMLIYQPEAVEHLEDVHELPDLPFAGDGDRCITMIQCGIDPRDAQTAADRCFTGTEVEGGKIDDVLAEILGEDLWKDALCKAPHIVHQKE